MVLPLSLLALGPEIMKLIIRGECPDPNLDNAARRYLALALSRYATWIQKVNLEWREENGVGLERNTFRCDLRMRLRNNEEAEISVTAADLLQAIQLAAERASRVAARRWTAFRQHSPLNPTPER